MVVVVYDNILKHQLTLKIAVARFAEPMAYTSVFPYLPAMIKSFGVEQNKVAKWVGLTSGVFSISQSITAVGWGKASDIYGRKPTIIFGLLSTMVCFIIWGMSTSLSMAITVRAIQGGGNGNGTLLPKLLIKTYKPVLTEKQSWNHSNNGGRDGPRKVSSTESLLHHAPCLEFRKRYRSEFRWFLR